MSVRSNLIEAQTCLTERFATLRDGRSGPIFFIEHGLSETGTRELREMTRQYAERCSLLDVSWRSTPLPLIVTATEVGYAYRGTGTDFWPNLEAALDTNISYEARHRVRDLFSTCSLKFRGTMPPKTAWTNAFGLIAWPITHALVPLEFHRQLSAALANLQVDIQKLDDAQLQDALRSASQHPSVRFASFLQDHSHALSVIRALLGSKSAEVSQDTVSRIDIDLKADSDARLNIAIARRKQQHRRASSRVISGQSSIHVQKGLLRLRHRGGQRLVIEAAFPSLRNLDLQQLRRALLRRRHMFTLWGVTSGIPSEQLLSALPFAVKLLSLPASGVPLLSGLEQLGVDAELLAILKSLDLDFQPPLLFSANSEGDLAQIVRGNEISASRMYWLLKEEERGDPLTNFPILGEVGTLTCFKLDASESGSAEALRRLGYRLRQPLPFTIIGAPPLDYHDRVPRFLVGDERIVVPSSNHPAGMEVSVNDESVSFDGNLVRASVTEGDHVLAISSPGSVRHDRFKGVQPAKNEFPPVCSVELCADDRSVQALLGNMIAIRIDGVAPLDGLTLTIELDFGCRMVGASIPLLGPLPQFIPSDKEPWPTLLDDATRERIVRESQPILLRARVGALAEESWLLERRLRPCWWTRRTEGFMLESDHGPIEHGVVSAGSPVAKPSRESPADMTMGILLAPLHPNEKDFGPAAGFATFVTAPAKANLAAPDIEKPHVRRRLRGSQGSVGIENLAEAWLRWSLAECDSLAADIRRQQVSAQLDRWLAELTCGEVWARREEAISSLPYDPWALLAREWFKSGIGLNEPIQFTEREKHEAALLAIAAIRRTHPDLWERIDGFVAEDSATTRARLEDDDYASFDRACTAAYQQIAERHRKLGISEPEMEFEWPGSGATPKQWCILLENVASNSDLRELGELLLPTDTAQSLMSLDLAPMSLGEITEEFHLWARASQSAFAGPLPERVMLQSILAFWISPEVAVSLDWRSAMNPLMIERPLARAARYLALRARAVRQSGELR